MHRRTQNELSSTCMHTYIIHRHMHPSPSYRPLMFSFVVCLCVVACGCLWLFLLLLLLLLCLVFVLLMCYVLPVLSCLVLSCHPLGGSWCALIAWSIRDQLAKDAVSLETGQPSPITHIPFPDKYNIRHTSNKCNTKTTHKQPHTKHHKTRHDYIDTTTITTKSKQTTRTYHIFIF